MKGREGLSEVERLPARATLLEVARRAAQSAFEARKARFPHELEGVSLDVAAADANTSLGNAAEVLARGAQSDGERELARCLTVLAFAADFPSAPETERASARCLLWLEAHAGLSLLAPLLEHLSDGDAKGAATLRAALAELAQPGARDVLPSEALLARHTLESEALPLEGELGASPRSGWVTALQALTLWLFVSRSLGVVARLCLGYRTPARATLSSRGLELEHRTELLGRKLRESSLLVPFAELGSLEREARFARAGLYAGLASLALGTYLGGGFLSDALRAPGGSASLFGLGLLLVVLGVALDFALSSLFGGEKSRCRVVILPRRGRGFTLRGVARARADALLGRALSHASPPASSRAPEPP